VRHKGCISQVNIKRDKAILSLYRQAMNIVEWPTDCMKICEIAANLPAPEFFISEETALVYIRDRYINNKNHRFNSPYRQRLYDALYQRFVSLREVPSNSNKDILSLVLEALQSQAPCIGITPQWIYYVITRQRKQRHSRHA